MGALAFEPEARAAGPKIELVRDASGDKLVVNGHDFIVKGVVWSYSPIGTNYAYSLWNQPDALIERVLADQMGAMQRIGINAIRVFDVPPPRWIKYIYETYGIYNIVDNMMGRYGVTRDGVWIAHVNYADPDMRAFLLSELQKQVIAYKDTPGILMWALGNENNYGLTWTSAEAEALPTKREDSRAEAMYSLMSAAAQLIKRFDQSKPVALVNGDLQYLDIIAKNAQGLDIFGTNQYRGPVAGKLYAEVKQKLHLPVVFTEFGADAFNARTGHEDGLNQARTLRRQWQEIYENSYGKGYAANSLGGFVFQWEDDWWKVGQDYDLDVHNTTATWPQASYYDYVPGENNMNEEWWGINGIQAAEPDGFFHMRHRTAYFMLKDVFKLNPYADGVTVQTIRDYFVGIQADDYEPPAEAELAREDSGSPLKLSRLLLKLETTSSAGTKNTARGDRNTFDHLESAYVDVTLQPSSKLYARLSLNFTANAAQNRLDPIYYENVVPPAHPYVAPTANGGKSVAVSQGGTSPLNVYQAEIKAEHPWFDLNAFYRVGHTGWDYEGDLFHLYPEAYYQEAVDTYRAVAPFGAVISGKRAFSDFKVAFGPAVYWGANPTIIGKYHKELGPVSVTAMHQEDVASAAVLPNSTTTSSVIPGPVTRRSTLGVGAEIGESHLEVGGIFAGSQRVGDEYTRAVKTSAAGYANSGYDAFVDRVGWGDTLGAKAKFTSTAGPAAFYLQGAAKGLVTDAGPDTSTTITGWSLKESGRGNQLSALGGVALTFGSFQIAPNGLIQKPFVGPNPTITGSYDAATNTLFRPIRPRNQFDDPFVVLDNRETEAGELLLLYDPTPATRFFTWDRVNHEDAPFAGSLDFVYRHQPTSRDSRIGILDTGQAVPFGGAPPAHDVWDLTGNWSANPLPFRLSGSAYFGQNQANGIDPRLVTRYGAGLRIGWEDFLFTTRVAFNDWGPYDYYRDYNLTYPFQWYGDTSWGLFPALFGIKQTRFGVRGQFRTMDAHSAGWLYSTNPGTRGDEWEVTTYVHATL